MKDLKDRIIEAKTELIEWLNQECGSDRLHFTWQGFDGYERCLDCGYEDEIDKFADN